MCNQRADCKPFCYQLHQISNAPSITRQIWDIYFWKLSNISNFFEKGISAIQFFKQDNDNRKSSVAPPCLVTFPLELHVGNDFECVMKWRIKGNLMGVDYVRSDSAAKGKRKYDILLQRQ